jgi:hypothetical protein
MIARTVSNPIPDVYSAHVCVFMYIGQCDMCTVRIFNRGRWDAHEGKYDVMVIFIASINVSPVSYSISFDFNFVHY